MYSTFYWTMNERKWRKNIQFCTNCQNSNNLHAKKLFFFCSKWWTNKIYKERKKTKAANSRWGGVWRYWRLHLNLTDTYRHYFFTLKHWWQFFLCRYSLRFHFHKNNLNDYLFNWPVKIVDSFRSTEVPFNFK